MSMIIDISCSRHVPDSAALYLGYGHRHLEKLQMWQLPSRSKEAV